MRCVPTHASEQEHSARLTPQVPADAYCVLGLTMEDIWSRDLVFVFGLASLAARVGVFSFVRLDPAWFRSSVQITDDLRVVHSKSTEREPGDVEVMFARALWTLAHECGHMFGIR